MNNVSKKDGTVYFWTLWDYADRGLNNSEVRSTISKGAYRCADKYYRAISYKEFSGNIGSGRVIKEEKDVNTKWIFAEHPDKERMGLFNVVKVYCQTLKD